MIKTLRITSIIAAILAGILFVFPVVFGVRGDEQVEQVLSSAGVIENFNKLTGHKVEDGDDRSSPLVRQAQALALYLNPPKPKVDLLAQRGGTASPLAPVTAKFTLLGTSFYAARPELSMAFIDEPGRGCRWLRLASQVGHLTIEQIKDGLIVVRDGQRTFELAAEKRPEMRSLLEGSASGAVGPKPGISATRGVRTSVIGRTMAEPQISAEESEALELLVDRLKNLRQDLKSEETDSAVSPQEKAEIMERLISDFKSARVSAEEAEKLGDLGEELEDVQQELNGMEYSEVSEPAEPAEPVPPEEQ